MIFLPLSLGPGFEAGRLFNKTAPWAGFGGFKIKQTGLKLAFFLAKILPPVKNNG
jgi:hypothetical protein